jgi:tetratricopeptide (TPR) repeat protein
MTLYGLGNIYFELGDYTKARKCYEDALRIAEKSKEKSLIALILNNLGAVENVFGNTKQAIKFYQRAIPIYTELNNSSGLARLYNNMGMTYAEEKDWASANAFYGKSLGFSDILGLTPLKSLTFLNRAQSLAELDKLEEAKEYSFKALRLLRQLKDELGLAEYHKLQALLCTKEYNWQKAEEHFALAIDKFEHFNNKLGLAETLYEKGMMEIDRNYIEEGINWLNKASIIFVELGLNKKSAIIHKKIGKYNIRQMALANSNQSC